MPDQTTSQRFYTLLKGKGSNVQVVSPNQGVVERAKSTLRRQIKDASRGRLHQSAPRKKGIYNSSLQKRKHNSKRRKRTKPKKRQRARK